MINFFPMIPAGKSGVQVAGNSKTTGSSGDATGSLFSILLQKINGSSDNTGASQGLALLKDTTSADMADKSIGANPYEKAIKNTDLITSTKSSTGNMDQTLSAVAVPQLVSFLKNKGFSSVQIEKMILSSTNSEGLVRMDKLVAAMGAVKKVVNPDIQHNMTAKTGLVVDTASIPKVEALLFKMGLGVGEVRSAVEKSVNGKGSLSLDKLTNALKGLTTGNLSGADLVSLLEQNNIVVQSQIPDTAAIESNLDNNIGLNHHASAFTKAFSNGTASLFHQNNIIPQSGISDNATVGSVLKNDTNLNSQIPAVNQNNIIAQPQILNSAVVESALKNDINLSSLISDFDGALSNRTISLFNQNNIAASVPVLKNDTNLNSQTPAVNQNNIIAQPQIFNSAVVEAALKNDTDLNSVISDVDGTLSNKTISLFNQNNIITQHQIPDSAVVESALKNDINLHSLTSDVDDTLSNKTISLFHQNGAGIKAQAQDATPVIIPPKNIISLEDQTTDDDKSSSNEIISLFGQNYGEVKNQALKAAVLASPLKKIVVLENQAADAFNTENNVVTSEALNINAIGSVNNGDESLIPRSSNAYTNASAMNDKAKLIADISNFNKAISDFKKEFISFIKGSAQNLDEKVGQNLSATLKTKVAQVQDVKSADNTAVNSDISSLDSSKVIAFGPVQENDATNLALPRNRTKLQKGAEGKIIDIITDKDQSNSRIDDKDLFRQKIEIHSFKEALKQGDQKTKQEVVSTVTSNNTVPETQVIDGKDVKSGVLEMKETPLVGLTSQNLAKISEGVDLKTRTKTAASLPDPLPKIFDRLVIMIKNGEQTGKLIIQPPELGKIDINLTIRDGHIQANLSAENYAVKEIIETNLNQLKQQLTDQGLIVEQFNVSVGSQHRQFHDENNRAWNGGNGSSQSGAPDISDVSTIMDGASKMMNNQYRIDVRV
jgi:flagellar hook-length control protein FliK